MSQPKLHLLLLSSINLMPGPRAGWPTGRCWPGRRASRRTLRLSLRLETRDSKTRHLTRAPAEHTRKRRPGSLQARPSGLRHERRNRHHDAPRKYPTQCPPAPPSRLARPGPLRPARSGPTTRPPCVAPSSLVRAPSPVLYRRWPWPWPWPWPWAADGFACGTAGIRERQELRSLLEGGVLA